MIAATPLVLAATGELVAERAGVLNLGVEGMMVTGALAAFAALMATGKIAWALTAAVVAGTGMATLFAVLALSLRANQVAAGLALTMFGLGLSALAGQGYSGQSAGAFPRPPLARLRALPPLGKPPFPPDGPTYPFLALPGAT